MPRLDSVYFRRGTRIPSWWLNKVAWFIERLQVYGGQLTVSNDGDGSVFRIDGSGTAELPEHPWKITVGETTFDVAAGRHFWWNQATQAVTINSVSLSDVAIHATLATIPYLQREFDPASGVTISAASTTSSLSSLMAGCCDIDVTHSTAIWRWPLGIVNADGSFEQWEWANITETRAS